jgi:hypothetical protein
MSLIKLEKLEKLDKMIAKIEVKPSKIPTTKEKECKLMHRELVEILTKALEINVTDISFTFLKNSYQYNETRCFMFFLMCKENDLMQTNELKSSYIRLNKQKVIAFLALYPKEKK